jgi:hypothetical protein
MVDYLAKYLSFSGGSINSAPCALEDINFTIGLNGIVTPIRNTVQDKILKQL